jgi:hypothetical protein
MSAKRQVVDSKGVPAPSNCFLPFNNPFLFVIPTGANPDFLQRRKSGVAEGRDLRCAIRMPHIYRSAPLSFSFVISGKPDAPYPDFRTRGTSNIQEPQTTIPIPLFLNLHQLCTSAASPGQAQQTKLKLPHG